MVAMAPQLLLEPGDVIYRPSSEPRVVELRRMHGRAWRLVRFLVNMAGRTNDATPVAMVGWLSRRDCSSLCRSHERMDNGLQEGHSSLQLRSCAAKLCYDA
jgi:hypothetical protein